MIRPSVEKLTVELCEYVPEVAVCHHGEPICQMIDCRMCVEEMIEGLILDETKTLTEENAALNRLVQRLRKKLRASRSS